MFSRADALEHISIGRRKYRHGMINFPLAMECSKILFDMYILKAKYKQKCSNINSMTEHLTKTQIKINTLNKMHNYSKYKS